jgi:hypothetical protein
MYVNRFIVFNNIVGEVHVVYFLQKPILPGNMPMISM